MRQWLASFTPFLEKKQGAIFLLGITSGFPLTLVISLMSYWLRDYGVQKSTIGIFALATLPYAWKFLWAPAIDKLPLGMLSRLLGQRRAWFLLLACLIAAAIIFLATLNPDTDVYLIGLTVAVIGFLSASLDIVIDAYRIELLDEKEMPRGATMITFGYRAGNLIAGYGALRLADILGWGPALLALILLLIPGIFAMFWVGEPLGNYGLRGAASAVSSGPKGIRLRVREAVIDPFKEFMSRSNWILILAFIFFFKLGDAVSAIMTGPLLIDLAFTKTEIADANKLAGTVALWLGIALGGVLYSMIGTYRTLFLTGFLMMVTNLGFVLLVFVGRDIWMMAAVIGAENFATGLGTTVMVTYLSSLCNISFTATQYALLNSFANQGRAIFGSVSGVMVDGLGWISFFGIATLLAVPGLILLYMLMRRGVDTLAPTAPAEP